MRSIKFGLNKIKILIDMDDDSRVFFISKACFSSNMKIAPLRGHGVKTTAIGRWQGKRSLPGVYLDQPIVVTDYDFTFFSSLLLPFSPRKISTNAF